MKNHKCTLAWPYEADRVFQGQSQGTRVFHSTFRKVESCDTTCAITHRMKVFFLVITYPNY